jgi:hypothetical protein|eukprot:COSAG01_NODE_1673_length_9542_cov_12.825765_14_plen_156_part_00
MSQLECGDETALVARFFTCGCSTLGDSTIPNGCATSVLARRKLGKWRHPADALPDLLTPVHALAQVPSVGGVGCAGHRLGATHIALALPSRIGKYRHVTVRGDCVRCAVRWKYTVVHDLHASLPRVVLKPDTCARASASAKSVSAWPPAKTLSAC